MLQDSSHPSGHSDPALFKGIALFTPGGDVVYCIDYAKQNRWHLQLCAVFQEMLGLAELPHFLVPCYTATVDRWLDPKTHALTLFAEAAPLVIRHQALLNVLFGTDMIWHPADTREMCDPTIMASYRKQFPQLWEDHDLVIRYDKTEPPPQPQSGTISASWSPMMNQTVTQPHGYVLRLFVAGSSSGTERILKRLHELLDQNLQQPYTLKVIDVHKHPDLAESDQVAATPTLVRVWPLPVKRIVGEFNEGEMILRLVMGGGGHPSEHPPHSPTSPH